MSTSNPNTLPPRKRHRSPSSSHSQSPQDPDEAVLQTDAICEVEEVVEEAAALEVDSDGEEEFVEEVVEEVEEEVEEEVVEEVEEEVVEEVDEEEVVEEVEEEVEVEEEDGASDSIKDDSEVEEEDKEDASDHSRDNDSSRDDRRAKRRKLDLTVEICRNFTKKSCFRPEIDCKFAHPHANVAVEGDQVTACADSLRDACFRGRTCKYYHPPLHIQKHLREVNGIAEPRARTRTRTRTVCKDSLRGRCLRGKECRFLHDSDDRVVVCKDFMRGRCLRGKECRFIHSSSLDDRFVVCQDFLRGLCKRRTCKYSHVSPHEAARLQLHGASEMSRGSGLRRDDRKSTTVCTDFLNNKCFRESCKYSHPKLRRRSPEPEREGRLRVPCRDFLRGLCRRSDCRFYHSSRAR